MTLLTDTTTQVTLSEPAAQAVRGIMTEKNLQGYALRLFISGGGCSGYQYGLALDNNVRTEDAVFETDGIRLIVDEVSINYLQGATVDYVEGESTSGFKIINPTANLSCSCSQGDTSSDDTSDGCPGCG